MDHGIGVGRLAAMDDRHAMYIIAVTELCAAAATADLAVELQTTEGREISGVPTPASSAHGADEVGDTGYGACMQIEGATIDLESIAACTIRAPRG